MTISQAHELLDRSADIAQVGALLRTLHDALERGDRPAAAAALAPDAVAVTSHLGRHEGAAVIAAALVDAIPVSDLVRLRLTNSHVAVQGDRAVQSAYLLSTFANNTPSGELDAFLSGGHYTVRYVAGADGWRITELRFELDWHHGSPSWVPGWTLPAGIGGWHRQWRVPAVSPELDSPWRVMPSPDGAGSKVDEVKAAYIRYAWALDQADFDLLATAFTDDAQADMSPFGPMKGRREIVASLKALRNGQPFLQHAAPAMEVEIDGDRAAMRIFRSVPVNVTRETIDAPIYAAQYESRLRRQDGVWKFEWLHYQPGWVTGPEPDPIG